MYILSFYFYFIRFNFREQPKMMYKNQKNNQLIKPNELFDPKTVIPGN